MNCDMLLAWMTHIGKGSWIRFRKAVEEVADGDCDPLDLYRALRVRFSDLGFADFFIYDTQQWRMLPPVLGGLAVQKNTVALYGSRTPHLAETLKNVAEEHGCRFEAEILQDCPTLIRVFGDKEEIAAIANRVEIPYESNNARIVAEKAIPIPHMLETATKELAPRNWQVRSFDFKTGVWVEHLLHNAACEFIPSHGRSKYFVNTKCGKLLRMPRRESLYTAAMLKRVRLIEYEFNTMKLSTPLFAPMPELYARAACLCSCRPAEILNGRIIYSDVTPEVAALLMVSAGQPHPGFSVLAKGGR